MRLLPDARLTGVKCADSMWARWLFPHGAGGGRLHSHTLGAGQSSSAIVTQALGAVLHIIDSGKTQLSLQV
jgi:hypothetical protein